MSKELRLETPTIRSRGNPILGTTRLLLRGPEERRGQGAYVAAGVRVVEEALRWRSPVDCALCSPRLLREPRGRRLLGKLQHTAPRLEIVTDELLGWVLGTPRHQGVVVHLKLAEHKLADLVDTGRHPLLVLAWGIQDPGNLGGLIRVAGAAGAGGMLAVEGTADPHNLKAVRASAGVLFRMPVVRRLRGRDVLRRLGEAGYRRVGAVARGGTRYDELSWRPPLVLIVGGEAAGVPDAALRTLEHRVTVPMAGEVESLNVLSAATLLLYEAARHTGFSGEKSRR